LVQVSGIESRGREKLLRLFLKLLLACLGILAITVIGGLYWLLLYSRDLPDLDVLSQFSPSGTTTVSDTCYKTPITAISYDALGRNLRAALNAVEASEDGPTAYEQTSRTFSDVRDARVALSIQIARTMFCSPERTSSRELKELRLAVRLDRHFSRQQLFTIAANRYYFGNDVVGVQVASRYLFQKDPKDLSVAEAALLAGLVRAPNYFSPANHPDRALTRRNQVVDAMLQNHSISAELAEAAKSTALNVAIP
jgi:penicillin-binding protein 1A